MSVDLYQLPPTDFARQLRCKSRHDRPVQQVCQENRRKWRLVRTMLANQEYKNWLHPVLARLGSRAYRPQGPSVQLSAAQKISRRLRSRPLPRFRPFQCSRCGLATHHLHLVRDHQCRKRRRRAPNPEEVQRCLELGGKSGLRNWMRVLEGAEQSVQFAMPRLHFVSHLDLHCNQPNSSTSVPECFLQSRPLDLDEPTEQLIQNQHTDQKLAPALACTSTSAHNSLEDELLSEFVYICMHCRAQFPNYQTFDQHLNERGAQQCSGKKNDMKVLRQGRALPLRCSRVENSAAPADALCLACGRRAFDTVAGFQRHVLDCALAAETLRAGL